MVTREMKDAVNRCMQYDEDYLDDDGYAFYYRCLFNYKMSLLDADEYATLNTLIGYDIGVDNAMRISAYLWEHEIETLELPEYEESKQDVKAAVEALHLDVDLSNWKSDKFEGYKYYAMWDCTDSDCCQYIRNEGKVYEMIQAVWLDTTDEDIANGGHEYCIARIKIDLDDYSDEEKEMHIRSYGYTLESVVEEYGDDADSIIAECIMEDESLNDAYVIDNADSFEEAKKKIEAIVRR